MIRWVLYQIACQCALLPAVFSPFRMWVRVATYAASLALLVLLRGTGRRHPAAAPAQVALVVVLVSIFHPDTSSLLGGVATAAMYLAIVGPLFWVPRRVVEPGTFAGAIRILWAFHTISAAVGVLQVFVPGHFEPALSSVIVSQGSGYLQGLYITTVGGARVLRPMGLTDMPGGAAISGFYAALFGAGLLLRSTRLPAQLLYVGSMFVAMTVLFLAQVRSLFIAALLSLVMLVTGQALHHRHKLRSMRVLFSSGAIVIGALLLAVSVAGRETATGRLGQLMQSSTSTAYYVNRGHFLESTLTELLPRYPGGAGLARWGMMHAYFGSTADPDRMPFWAELQWTGWLLDGGVLLALAYAAAIVVAIVTAWRISRSPTLAGQSMAAWALLVASYDIGVFAMTFNATPFSGQLGMEFWTLNAMLFGAFLAARTRAAARPDGVT